MRLSNIPDYMEVVGRNHQMAWQAGEMIIRHLVLPNHVECCSKPLLKWISKFGFRSGFKHHGSVSSSF